MFPIPTDDMESGGDMRWWAIAGMLLGYPNDRPFYFSINQHSK
jgi:hypothetical protein